MPFTCHGESPGNYFEISSKEDRYVDEGHWIIEVVKIIDELLYDNQFKTNQEVQRCKKQLCKVKCTCGREYSEIRIRPVDESKETCWWWLGKCPISAKVKK